MIQAQPNNVIEHSRSPKVADIDAQFKLARAIVITAGGVFAGTVLGGVAGLFVYANSRTPSVHDGIYVVIQTFGVLIGVGLGYLAAKGAEAQEKFIEASGKAGVTLLKKYRTRPGINGNSNVGQRNIATNNVGDEYLRQLLASVPKAQ